MYWFDLLSIAVQRSMSLSGQQPEKEKLLSGKDGSAEGRQDTRNSLGLFEPGKSISLISLVIGSTHKPDMLFLKVI